MRVLALERLPWFAALLVAAAPMWVTRDLPLVDLPQHSYVVQVLAHLHDPGTLYPHYFELRPGFSPYLGHYTAVGILSRVMSIDTANRVFLTAYVIALPLSLAFLLRGLGRPTWPALLAIPLAYGDNFAWGYLNYCASLPLMFLSMGLCIEALVDAPRRGMWTFGLALCLALGGVIHPQPAIYLALAMPFIIITTRVHEDATSRGWVRRLRPRIPVLGVQGALALAGLVLGTAIALRSRTVRSALAQQDWMGVLHPGHFEFRAPQESLRMFPDLLTNMLRDGSDRLGVTVATCVALAAVVVSTFSRPDARVPAPSWTERARPFGLTAIALALYFTLPLHIYGFVGDVSPRLAPVAAAMSATLVPRLGARGSTVFLWLGLVGALATSAPLIRGFQAYDREASSLREIGRAVGDRPTIMGLMFDDDSRIVRHPVYLHSTATLAREKGGIPYYNLALWPQSPLRYRTTPPPTLADEARPDLFDYATHGAAYDHFLGRGRPPEGVFGGRLDGELFVATRAGDFWLVRRRPSEVSARTPRDSIGAGSASRP